MILAFVTMAATNASRVLVIENTASPASIEIAEDYMKKRGVTNVLKVACQDSAQSTAMETMPYAAFQEKIENSLKAYLAKKSGIDFIVLTKGVPIRLTGAKIGGRWWIRL